MSSSVATPATSALKTIVSLNATQSVAATVEALTNALASRYSSLEEASDVRSALETLRLAESCGLDPGTEGAAGFSSWLAALETIPTPADDEDEDMVGGSFGHNTIGSWAYRDGLKQLSDWGSVKNACRLLSALLRIWAMAKDQLRTMNKTEEPIVKRHITQVSQIIETSFQLTSGTKAVASGAPTDITNTMSSAAAEPSSTAADPIPVKQAKGKRGQVSAAAVAESSSSAVDPAKEAKRKRGQVEKNLDNGIVNEEVINSLSKRAAMKLLALGGIEVRAKARADEVQRTLNQALQSGKVKISAKQVRQAESKLEVEGSIRVDPKGKGKAA
ncbi:hypothetical protein CF326_g8112 [Tilletia indica]|nr:hypothetical protein CF326_g8112 [Tilletia indica]